MNEATGKHCKKSSCGSFEHNPNLCIAQRVCENCFKQPVNKDSKCKQCGKNNHTFSGPKAASDFCDWLFNDDDNVGATAICHNFKGYDAYPLLRYLYDNCIIPNVVANGSKYMSIEVRQCKVRMIDSFNFLPCALSKLPAMFGIEELAKGYFPHLYNTKKNKTKRLTKLPDMKFYNPDGMKNDAK